MKLLFLTQVFDRNDAVLGFVPRWIEGLAGRVERLRVVALEVGEQGELPANVDLREVGRRGVVRRYLRYRSILSEAFGEGFDTVLAHMVPRYALLAASPAARAGARGFLWYTHGGVDGRLKRALGVVDKVFTASAESMRVETPKKVVTGHGIDLQHFQPPREEPVGPPRLLVVGRLTPRKDPLTLLAAAAILVSRGYDVQVELAGPPLAPGDESYLRRVREQIEVGGLGERVTLHGAVPYPEIPELYRRATVLVNPSLTGSVDKVVLEAMACARPVLTCNEAFPPLFAPLGGEAEQLLFEPGSAEDLARKLEVLMALPPARRRALGDRLRALVQRDHDVERLLDRLVAEMEPGP